MRLNTHLSKQSYLLFLGVGNLLRVFRWAVCCPFDLVYGPLFSTEFVVVFKREIAYWMVRERQFNNRVDIHFNIFQIDGVADVFFVSDNLSPRVSEQLSLPPKNTYIPFIYDTRKEDEKKSIKTTRNKKTKTKHVRQLCLCIIHEQD